MIAQDLVLPCLFIVALWARTAVRRARAASHRGDSP